MTQKSKQDDLAIPRGQVLANTKRRGEQFMLLRLQLRPWARLRIDQCIGNRSRRSAPPVPAHPLATFNRQPAGYLFLQPGGD